MSVLIANTNRWLNHHFKIGPELWWVLCASLLTISMSGSPQKPATKEYQVKAVFLFNFTQFVEWPANAFATANAPLVIGVLGDDPFGPYLDALIQGEKINEHPLIARRFKNVEDIRECHILFINIPDREELRETLEDLQYKNILTVGDANNFTRYGGMIRFATETNKIKIHINLEPAKEANLTISSKLLRLAEIVPSKNN